MRQEPPPSPLCTAVGVFKKAGSIPPREESEGVSASRTVVTSGLVALLIGLSLIAIISASGVPPVRLGLTTSTSTPSSENTGGGTQAGTTTTTGGGSIAGTTSTTSTEEQAAGSQGTLTVLLTDPPRVPAGVTAVYVYYVGLAAHGENGWVGIKDAGAIELMGTVDVALTLSSASIPAGTYDTIRFEVSSALVTFLGANHTAIVQGGQLTLRILGGAVVSATQAGGALIDIQPTVVNVGTSSGPQFILWASARAFPVPTSQITGDVDVAGHRFSLRGLAWWETYGMLANATLNLSGVSLSANSLSLNVADVGSSGTFLKLVVISASNFSPTAEGTGTVPISITSSAVFVVLDNGTLVQFLPLLHAAMPLIRGESQASVLDALLMSGYNLTAGATVHLSYSESIELSFGLLTPAAGITSGTTYWVTVIGNDAVATTSVIAT